jgi:hypothetical protein
MTGFRYWRIVSTVANSVSIGFKAMFLNQIRLVERDAQFGMHTSYAHGYIDHQTDTGYRWTYDLLMATRTVNATFNMWTDSGLQDLLDWYMDAGGRVKVSVLIPDTRVNDAMFVRFMAQPADLVPAGSGGGVSTLVTQQDKVNRRSTHVAWDEAVGGAPEWQ